MTNAANLVKNPTAQILLVGFPGSGKTGSLACLANAGFKLRILDFDGNLEPLLLNTKPDFLPNIDAVFLADTLRGGDKSIEVVGLPSAFRNALKLMDQWKYTEPDGTEVDLGASKDWGPDTIVVLDGVTNMGVAAFRKAMATLNKTPLTITWKVWGLGAADQAAFIDKLVNKRNRFHLVVTSHLKMVGPKDIEKGDSELTAELKEKIAAIVSTRLYPTALGQVLPQTFAGAFPCTILVEPDYRGNSARRKLKFMPRPELDLKFPVSSLSTDLDVETGMLKVFQALGCHPPKVQEVEKVEGTSA